MPDWMIADSELRAMNEKEFNDRLAYLLFKKMEEELAYIALRKKCIAEMKQLGLIPEGYREVYTVAGREIT